MTHGLLTLRPATRGRFDSEPARLTFSAAIEAFLTARAAEGASPATITWYRMVLGRTARDLGPRRQLDALTAEEVRAWLATLRQTLSPISVAVYVRGLKAFGNYSIVITGPGRVGCSTP